MSEQIINAIRAARIKTLAQALAEELGLIAAQTQDHERYDEEGDWLTPDDLGLYAEMRRQAKEIRAGEAAHNCTQEDSIGYMRGDRFKLYDGGVYILATPFVDEVRGLAWILICTDDGNRWCDPVYHNGLVLPEEKLNELVGEAGFKEVEREV